MWQDKISHLNSWVKSGEGRERKKREGGERSSTFSLDLTVVGPSAFVRAKGKVRPNERASHRDKNPGFSPSFER